MISRDTLYEIAPIIDRYSHAELDRMLMYLEIDYVKYDLGKTITIPNRVNAFLGKIENIDSDKSQSGEHIHLRLLKYVINKFYENKPHNEIIASFGGFFSIDEFDRQHENLIRALERDGYIIKNRILEKKLPEDIALPQQRDELTRHLDKFNLNITKGHLGQAIKIHGSGDWAAANSQFRSFFESVLMDIAKILKPNQTVYDAMSAMKCLKGNDINFFTDKTNDFKYANGLWSRLQSEGSHPGLSDEEDCTFRYHTCLIYVRYLLKKLVAHKDGYKIRFDN